MGKWELRNVMVVDTSPLPSMGSYCYGHKVGYIDTDTWTQLGWDFYDINQKFWKMNMIPMRPLRIDTGDVPRSTPPTSISCGTFRIST